MRQTQPARFAATVMVLLVTGCEQSSDPCVPDEPAAVEITGPESLVIGTSAALAASVVDGCGAALAVDVEWSVAPAGRAHVDAGGTVSATDTGAVVVRAAAATRPHVADSIVLRIVYPLSVRLAAATQIAWTQSHIWVTGALVDTTGAVVGGPALGFVSADPAIATVDSTGRIEGHSPGTTYIVGTATGAQPDTLAIEVREPDPVGFVIRGTPYWRFVEPGAAWSASSHVHSAVATSTQPAQLEVWLHRVVGDTVPYTGPVAWASSAPAVVTVDASGIATGHAVGRVTVTVSDPAGQIPAGMLQVLSANAYQATAVPPNFTAFALNEHAVVGRTPSVALLMRNGQQDTIGVWEPRAINGEDVVVGYRGGDGIFPVIWQDGVQRDLPLGSCASGSALGINDSGLAVGTALCDGVTAAVLWAGDSMRVLSGNGAAYSIDEAGNVYGTSGGRAVVWSPAGSARVLAVAGEVAPTAARAGNGAGVVVGSATVSGSRTRGVRWLPGGAALTYEGAAPTHPALPPSMILEDINEAGVMVGKGGTFRLGTSGEYTDVPVVVHAGLPPIALSLLASTSLPGQVHQPVRIDETGRILTRSYVLTPITF